MTAAGRPPLRLAFLIGTVAGGTAAHVAALAGGCVRAGAEVTVFGPDGARASFDPAIGYRPAEIGDRPWPAHDAAVLAGLRRQIRDLRPDVLHAHGVRAGALAVLAALAPRQGAAGYRAPALVVTVHNAPPDGAGRRAVFWALERLCARRSDVVLCASDDLVARMRRLGAATAARFDVPARPAAPPSAAAVASAAADIGAGGRPVVLAAGRLARQKGFDVLIAAAARWCAEPGAPVTVIAGDGPLAAPLREQVRLAGADVLLLGDRRDIPALLAVADVFVLPSRWEARALVLQEAMRAGRAIVATKTGGTPELTGADSAVLVPPEDDAALAEAVLAVLADPALAAALGLAARARAAAFPTEDDALRQALDIYRRLAVRRSAEPAAPEPLS
jgi:glycosyltransferase involved in cell wall biosynthesis